MEYESGLLFQLKHPLAYLLYSLLPTSHDRIKMIAKEAQGFLYCVSSLGVTGVRKEIKTDINGMIELVKEVSDVPCAVGFGI